MAKRSGSSSSKEVIKKPTKAELSDAARLLRQGHPAGGRVMADKSVWVKENKK